VPVIAAPADRWPFARRLQVILAGLAVAAALSVATVSNPWLRHAVSDGISEGLHGVQTVAAMLAERSPGARPEGALANLKHKRHAALHERALPKIRGPFAPPTAYEAIASPPSVPIVPPVEAPPFAALAGGPPITPVTGGGSGGPPFLSNIPTPGGGGGGFTPPIITTATPEVPPAPVAPVPEPASWAMMLLGFALMGRALRHPVAAGIRPAAG
jgi:hypothetical protein